MQRNHHLELESGPVRRPRPSAAVLLTFVGELAPGAECESSVGCAHEPNETVIRPDKCVMTRRTVGAGEACDELCGVDCPNDGNPRRLCSAEAGLPIGSS